VLLGKILRITRDGSAASGNRTGASCARAGRARRGARCAEIFARGLRNPFRMAFDPNAADTRFFINDVGYRDWEEVNEGRQGADYGWNLREARCRGPRTRRCGPPPPGLTDPIHAYHHRTGCRAITGGAFVPAGVWPEPFSGDYLFADFICGRIFRLEPRDGGGYIAHSFATGLPVYSVVDIAFGPDPQGSSLFYAGFADGGQVRRISYTGPAAGRSGASRSYFLATAR
jgi:glucose/arabinose dehydrogenase